jgi:serine/threonine-protein kinase
VGRFGSAQGALLLVDGANPLLALVGAGLGTYGAHVLNTLRQEVFEARRLNQYHLGERLGSGGMGDVYLAEHRLLKRRCALKLIRPESAGDPKALARFEREVRAAARLSHPNIVEIYDYGLTQDGTFYYVMEYLRGLSLADLVVRHGPLPAGRVIYLLRQASEGLAEAHAAGLIHRDLKPANLFAARVGTRYDVTKLLDFGLVKEVARGPVDLSGPGPVIGTPLYAAPEQAVASAALDHRADLYALGAVAYYLLTGRPPFEGDSVLGVLVAHARDPVVPPSRHRPDVPGDLERVVLRCLAKDPADRYPDAEALGQVLAACAASNEWDGRRAATWWQEAGHEDNAGTGA